jgi:alpha-methylacyl-CoA racemase
MNLAPSLRLRPQECKPKRTQVNIPAARIRLDSRQRNEEAPMHEPTAWPRPATVASGPLAGVKVMEFAGIGPGPFACMLLTDMGADVLRIGRPGEMPRSNVTDRGRRHLGLDLKDKADLARALALIGEADALIEGFRPGVMERLGLGPDVALARNPRLVYGRMTGWGQEGPLAQAAGHDINYISLTGALAAIGPRDKPVPPLNLVGDYGGGGLYLVVGVLAAIIEARRSGLGQVVDCAMVDGSASLMALFCELAAAGRWEHKREANMLDGGAPYYTVYECADGRFVSIGAIEPQFYALFRKLVGLDDPAFEGRDKKATWPELTKKAQAIFKTKTCAEWCKILEGTDVCFAPVLTLADAPHHPHIAGRRTFVEHDGVTQPAPAPRFSRTPSAIQPTSMLSSNTRR